MCKKLIISVMCAASVLALGVAPGAAATLFALVDTGELFVSGDKGVTWSIRSTLAVSDGVAIAAGETSDELYLATRSGMVYRSTDAGLTWNPAGVATAPDVADMVIRTNGDVLLLTETGLVLRSNDDGATFTFHATLGASNFVAIDGDEGGGNLYALTASGEVSRSDDGGTTWQVVGVITTPDAVEIQSRGLDLFVLTSTGNIAMSVDAGVNWTTVGTISQVNMTGFTQSDGGLVAATSEGLVATSANGASWGFTGSINQLHVTSIGDDTPGATGIKGQTVASAGLRVRSLWPNPVPGDAAVSVAVELSGPAQLTLRIYSVKGELVATRSPESFGAGGEVEVRWPTSGLASGVYFIAVSSSLGSAASAKLVIAR